MPVRLITSLLLIIAMLFNGVALAADVHSLSTGTAHSISDHPANPAENDSHPVCAHCCHGVFHLFGLSSTAPLQVSLKSSDLLPLYAYSITLFYPPLPLRPPIFS